MDLDELQESKRSKTAEFEALVTLSVEEERKLTSDEANKVDELKREVENIEKLISEKEAEVLERQKAEEAMEQEIKAELKTELEESIREMSKLDAETELRKAEAEYEKAWRNYWEAVEAAEREAKKDEMRALIKEILNEPSMRNMKALKEEAEELKRQADEKASKLEADIEIERNAKKDLETKLKQERSIELDKKTEMEDSKKTVFRYIKEAAKGGSQVDTITVKRAAVDGDTTAQAAGVKLSIEGIDVVGKEPIWEQMGVDIARGARGAYTLPYDDPKVATELAELSAVTGDAVSPQGISISPKRFPYQKAFTLETIASASDEFIQDQLDNMYKACDRGITAKIWEKALAGATSAATGTTLDKSAFDALMEAVEVDGDGAFISTRKTFFAAKKVKVDPGSGKFLVEKVSEGSLGKGKTYDETTYWHSSLFKDATNESRVCYGDLSKIYVADYGMYDIIVDKVTRAAEGVVVITVNKVADVALKNPNAFAVSDDFDATV